MYNVMLVLDDGEIRVIKSVKLISWTRARVIFTDVDERSYHYVGGRIQKCEMEHIGRCLTNEETE